jgi:hypothetical protein
MAAVPAVPAIVNQDLFIQAQSHHQPAGQNLIAQLTYPLQARFERWIKHKKAREDILVDVFNLQIPGNILNTTIQINFSMIMKTSPTGRYRLRLTITDHQGIEYIGNAPVMLTPHGQVDMALPNNLRTFYIRRR